MRNVRSIEDGFFFSKNEIDIALRKFGMDSLKFDKAGFKGMRISDSNEIVSNKVYLGTLYAAALENYQKSML